MLVNAQVNRVFGLSWVSDLNLFGKVMEYRMQDLPVDPKYQAVQAEVHAYVQEGKTDPFGFADEHGLNYGERGFVIRDDVFFERYGAYARSIVTRNIATYVQRSVPDLYRSWFTPFVLYPTYGVSPGEKGVSDTRAIPGITGFPTRYGLTPFTEEPAWVAAVLVFSTLCGLSFVLLSLVTAILACFLIRRPSHTASHTEGWALMAMALTVVGGMCVAAMGGYADFNRTRFPVD